MGAASTEFVEFVMDSLAPLGRVARERFFGGSSLKLDSALFAMIMDGALYFAVDEQSRPEYQRLGSRCFSYGSTKGRVEVKRFFEVPAEVLEDPERLLGFARTAVATAEARAAARRPRAKKPARS